MSERKKVLVIRLSSLGDLVLATAALQPLRRAGFEVSVVTKKAFAPLLAHHPDIKEVYPFEKTNGEAAAREKLFAWAEAQGFSFVLDLQDSWRTWIWRRTLRRFAPVFVARKERLREWLILGARLGAWFGFGQGGRARKFRRAALDALGAMGSFPEAGPPLTSLAVTEDEKASVQALLPPGDFVVLLPASAWKGKEWPYFPELASVLARKVPVVVLGAEKDLVCDEVGRRAAAVNPLSRSLRGQTSLRMSLAIIAQARWVIGNDTGLVHAGEALGKDVAMVEGPTHKRMGFSPYRERSVLLGLNLVCRPCSKSGKFCPRFGTYKCLNDLSVQGVAERLRRGGYPC